MMNRYKSQADILTKLGISTLNSMQEEAIAAIQVHPNVILLSPTGTGKTLAFALPIIAGLDVNIKGIQTIILAPSRELAIQIEQVMRQMGSGYKINVVYGGRSIVKDRAELTQAPSVLIGTPGRVADHLRRGSVDPNQVKTLVLDEFDKSLEIGFELDMRDIIEDLPQVQKRILTSATQDIDIPRFVSMDDAKVIDNLAATIPQLEIKSIISPDKDKLETLVRAINHLGSQPGIVFCNYRNSIDRISDYLDDHNIPHGTFYGGMEQRDRERALIKFRNGTHQLLIATDLAARGIDVPEIKHIIHYHLPLKSTEFTHRNGRTARMNKDGTAYVLHWIHEELPDFIPVLPKEELTGSPTLHASGWQTLFISGGRKDKISKGDIAGHFFKQGQLEKGQLGIIELKSDCAFVSVKHNNINALLQKVSDKKIKKRKVRITLI